MQPISLKYAGVTCGMLLLLCLSATNLYAQRKEITYKGNKVVLFVHPKDTTEVMDPLTGEEKFIITSKSDDVLSLNTEKVHKIDDERTVAILTNAVEQKIATAARKLDKATYHYYAETVVINKQGKVVYLQPGSIFPISVVDLDGKKIQPQIPKYVQTELNSEIAKIIESTKIPPVEVKGEAVNVVVHVNGSFVVE